MASVQIPLCNDRLHCTVSLYCCASQAHSKQPNEIMSDQIILHKYLLQAKPTKVSNKQSTKTDQGRIREYDVWSLLGLKALIFVPAHSRHHKHISKGLEHQEILLEERLAFLVTENQREQIGCHVCCFLH